MLEEILELHKQGRLEEAEARYRELLVFNPDDPETLHLLGIVRRQRGDMAEALELVRRALELNPERPTYFMTLAGIEMHAGQFDAAERDFRAALNLDPSLTSAYSALGQLALIKGDSEHAEEHYKFALAAGDERVEVLTGYGGILLRRGQTEMALRYFTRASELDPNDFAAQSGLARTFMARGNHAFAEQALKNLLERRPDIHAARRLLAEALLLQGRKEEARAALIPLLTVAQERASAIASLGDVSRAEENFGRAVSYYREALQADRNQPRVIEAMAWCLTRMNLRREAIAAYRAYLEHAPKDLDALRALAQLLAESGDPVQAAEAFRAAIAAGGDDAATRQGLAAMLEFAGELDAAQAEAETVVAENPAAPGAQLIRARALLRHGDPLAALAALEPLPDADTNPAARHNALALRGRVCDALGDPAAALAAWREAQGARAGRGPREFGTLDAVLAQALDRAAAAGVAQPIHGPAALLIGAPGSGVELVAALLSDAPGVIVLGDRFGREPRSDLFSQPEFERYLGAMDDNETRLIARHYERPLERLYPRHDKLLIDWLPHWDARWLPAVHRIFGPIPLIVAGRDPRDALLHWLALGSPQGLRVDEPDTAARWLRGAYEHLLWSRDHGNLPLVGIDAVSLLDDPAAAAQRLSTALAAPEFAPGRNFARARSGLGDLPVLLPRGRFSAYETVLQPAFAELAPLLSQFGG